jgi:hypothetical protein
LTKKPKFVQKVNADQVQNGTRILDKKKSLIFFGLCSCAGCNPPGGAVCAMGVFATEIKD